MLNIMKGELEKHIAMADKILHLAFGQCMIILIYLFNKHAERMYFATHYASNGPEAIHTVCLEGDAKNTNNSNMTYTMPGERYAPNTLPPTESRI